MKKLGKSIVTLSFAFVMVMALGVINVHAQDYDFADIKNDFLTGTPYTLTKDDSLKFGDEMFVGKDGRLAINSGEATIKYENGAVNVTFDGDATVNEGKNVFALIDLGTDPRLPMNITVNEGSSLHVRGTLIIPSGVNSTITNNGYIVVYDKANMEIRNRAANYQGTGNLNVFGNLAIYGNSGDNIGAAKIRLFSTGHIYSEANILDNVTVAQADSDTNNYELVESDTDSYTSVTAEVGTKTFPYGYSLKTVTENVPVTTPEEDTTTSNENKVTDTTVNPETSDGIVLFLGLTVVGFAGVALTYRRLHN